MVGLIGFIIFLAHPTHTSAHQPSLKRAALHALAVSTPAVSAPAVSMPFVLNGSDFEPSYPTQPTFLYI